MAKNWSANVNTKAYGVDTTYVENTEEIEFKSGKKRRYLKNSTPVKTHTFMLLMDDHGEKSEYKQFLNWYEMTIKSGAESFLFPDLITHTGLHEYRITGAPSATGQRKKEVNLTFEEV